MSYPKPWIIGDTIINDGIDWHLAEWASILRGWQGLPAARALLIERYGRWPVIAGIRRPGRSISLETHFMHGLAANRKLARTAYLSALNYEEEVPYRLLCTDFIPPNCATGDALLALGPWNVQTDGAGAWWVKDLIDPTQVPAFVGTTHFEDGRATGTKAAIFEIGATNHIINPSFEINVTDGWTNSGLSTFAQSALQTKFGTYSARCISVLVTDYAVSDTIADADAAETWTASCWVYLVSGDFELVIEENNVGWTEKAAVSANTSLLNQWQKVYVTATLTAGVTDGRLKLMPVATASSEFYVDGVDFVQHAHVSTHVDGALGPGYVWTGTAHNSTSTRTLSSLNMATCVDLLDGNDAFSFRLVFQVQYDHDGEWPWSEGFITSVRGSNNNNWVQIEYDTADDKFKVYINGDYRLESAAQTFEAGDWIEMIVTIDFASNSYNLYLEGAVSATDTTALVAMLELVTWRLGAYYTGANPGGVAFEQFQVFDRVLTAAEVAHCYNEALGARWLSVLCDSMSPLSTGGKETTLGFVANLMIDDDVRFHSRDGDVHFVDIYSSPWNSLLTTSTEDDARPVLHFTPTIAKAAGFLYKRWVPVVWKAEALSRYPVKLGELDTATLVTAGKMLATCNDLRVYDGLTEIDRWILDPNTATTDIWVNLDFSGTQVVTLEDAMLIGDAAETVQAAEDIGGFPTIGRFMIENEAFTYRGKDESSRTFLNVVRAAKGTAAAGHAAATDILWIEHDIWIYYDDATLGAPVVDADNEPLIELDTSTNDVWAYAYFGGNARPDRPYAWVQTPIESYTDVTGYENFWTADHITNADPWEELGVRGYRWDATPALVSGRFHLHHSLGITNANFTNGENRWVTTQGKPAIQSSIDGITWYKEYDIPQVGGSGVWTAWNRDEALNAGSKHVALYNVYFSNGTATWIEASDVAITLDNTNTPDATIGAEQGNYALDCTLANDVTGETIQLQANLCLDATLEVDAESKTVIDITEGENLFGALTLIGGVRRHWFPLRDGGNMLTYTEIGAVGVSLELVWDRRHLE